MKLQPQTTRLVPFSVFSLLLGAAFPALALDCAKAQTQADINQCAGQDLEQETARINRTYRAYLQRLDAGQQQQLKAVQLAWIKFKDLACQFESAGVAGGSAHPAVLANCLAEKTRQRNQELEALSRCQEGDLGCPAGQ
jgi:uncharacterized protein YecT (DUF1311 family)